MDPDQEPAAALPDTLALALNDTVTLADADAAAVTLAPKSAAKDAQSVMSALEIRAERSSLRRNVENGLRGKLELRSDLHQRR